MNIRTLTINAALFIAPVFGGGLAPDISAPRKIHSGKKESVDSDINTPRKVPLQEGGGLASDINAPRNVSLAEGGGFDPAIGTPRKVHSVKGRSKKSSKNSMSVRKYRSSKGGQKPRRKTYKSCYNTAAELSSVRSDQGEHSLFSEAAVLYLWSRQDDLYLGESVSGNSYTLLDPNFNWHPGFRVGFGYRNCKNDWTLGLNWTYFRSDPTTSATAVAINGLESDSTFTTATQNWQLTYNGAHLMLKGPASIKKNFSLKAAFGVEAAFLHQKRALDYVGSPDNMSIRDKNNFSGAGPSVAFEARFNLPYHFGLGADLGTSLLWGNIEASRIASGAADIQTTNNHRKVVAAIHTKVGFVWGGFSEKGGITLFLGWEMRHFWDQWQVHSTQNPLLNPKGGSLSISGLVFSTDVCF